MKAVLRAIAVLLAFSALLAETPAEEPAAATGPDRLAQLLRSDDAQARRRALVPLVDSTTVAEKYRPVLWQVLKDGDPEVRQFAAMALAASGLADRPILDELLRAMGDGLPRYYDRFQGPHGAQQALTKLGSKAVPALVDALENEKYPGRYLAIDALAAIGPAAKAALPALTTALRDPARKEFPLLVNAKWRIDGDAAYAIKELVPLLDTEQGRRCGGAITVLAGMGRDGKDAVPAIIRALKKHKEYNLTWALGELGHHAKQQALPALREALGHRATALEAASALRGLGVSVEEMVPELLRMFDRCREERIDPYGIAHEIAVYSSAAAVPGLVRALEHPNPAVRPAAAWALCRVGAESKDVVPALTQALKDKHAAEEAARSLQLIREAN